MNSSELKNVLLARTADLSMIPEIAHEALRLASTPQCSPGQLASVIEREPTIATMLLALSNSASYACGTPVIDLRQAVIRLGFRQCKNLILASSAASLMHRMPVEQEWAREMLNHHSFTTATMAMHLNRKFRLGFEGEEYSAGLLHDFGRLLISMGAPDRFSEVDSLEFDESIDVLAKEREILGTDHCEVGAWFAKRNGIPEPLVAVVQHHHEPHLEQPHQKIVALVAVADHVANHLQVCGEAGGYELSENTAIAVLSDLHGEDLSAKLAEDLGSVLEDVLADVQESLWTNSEAVK